MEYGCGLGDAPSFSASAAGEPKLESADRSSGLELNVHAAHQLASLAFTRAVVCCASAADKGPAKRIRDSQRLAEHDFQRGDLGRVVAANRYDAGGAAIEERPRRDAARR